VPRRVNMPPPEASKFTEKALLAVADDLKSRRLPLERTQLSDDTVAGLRAMISKTGEVSYAASYYFGGGTERKFLKIGSANKDSPDYLTLDKAREITKTIKALAERGTNVQDGLTRRLVRELLRDGVRWRAK
jgi:hypothetical protein